jgi:hypothetical protein
MLPVTVVTRDAAEEPNARETSYVSPRMLNDIDDAVELHQQEMNDNDTNSSDTWFVDTRDLRDVHNVAASDIWQQTSTKNKNDSEMAEDCIPEICQADLQMVMRLSPPSSVQRHSSDATSETYSSAASSRRSRTSRKSAMQRREQLSRDSRSSSDSDGEAVGGEAVLRRHHQQPLLRDHQLHMTTSTSISHTAINSLPPIASRKSLADDVTVSHAMDHSSNVDGLRAMTITNGPVVVIGDSDAQHNSNGKDDEAQAADSDGMTCRDNADKIKLSDSGCAPATTVSNVKQQATLSYSNQKSVPKSFGVPNFFLPPSDLEQSMRLLCEGAKSHPPVTKLPGSAEVEVNKALAAQELVTKLTSAKSRGSTKTVAPPQQSVEQVQRIARIFAQRLT